LFVLEERFHRIEIERFCGIVAKKLLSASKNLVLCEGAAKSFQQYFWERPEGQIIPLRGAIDFSASTLAQKIGRWYAVATSRGRQNPSCFKGNKESISYHVEAAQLPFIYLEKIICALVTRRSFANFLSSAKYALFSQILASISIGTCFSNSLLKTLTINGDDPRTSRQPLYESRTRLVLFRPRKRPEQLGLF